MNESYDDIRSRIPEPPKWWDEHAVPRYCDFEPRAAANIYAAEVALMHIRCQGCAADFQVCLSRSRWQTMETARALASFVKDNDLHYGDPPNVDCCPAGATMNSVPVRVLEFWKRDYAISHDWIRDPELEVAIKPDWWGGAAVRGTSE